MTIFLPGLLRVSPRVSPGLPGLLPALLRVPLGLLYGRRNRCDCSRAIISPMPLPQRLQSTDEHRRRFLTFFSGIGLGSTLLPGVLWSEMQASAQQADG